MKKIIFFLFFIIPLILKGDVRNSFPWGSSNLVLINNAKTELNLKLLTPLEINLSNNQTLDFFYALNPNEEIFIAIKNYSSTPIDLNKLKFIKHFSAETDSSIIKEIKTTDYDEFINNLPNQIKVKINYLLLRNIYVAHISIPKFFISQNRINSLIDINLEINHTNNSRNNSAFSKSNNFDTINDKFLNSLIVNYSPDLPLYKLNLSDTTGNWFNKNNQYLKFSIGKDGIYKINFTDIQNYAPFLINTNPKNWQLFNKGKEIPIKIFGDNDLSFNQQDYIIFSAEQNYTKKHYSVTTGVNEYNEYLNRYSDSTIFFLTNGITPGKRILENNFSIAPTETLRTYTETIHQELNSSIQFAGDFVVQSNYKWTSGDIFFWGWLNQNSQANSNNFFVSDFVPTSDSSTISAKFLSWGNTSNTSPAHDLALKINNSKILDSLYLEKYHHAVIKTKIPNSLITNGNNILNLVSRSTGSAFINVVIYDWFEISFPRKIKVLNDSLIIRFPNIKTSAIRSIEISGLTTTDISIFKYEKEKKEISNINFIGSAPNIFAIFIDSVSEGDIYFVQKNTNLLTPTFHGSKLFKNIRSSPQTDYILITNKIFEDESKSYLNLISTNLKLSTNLILVDDVYDEFNFGYFDPNAIRSFLKSTKSWPTPMPSYVFLVGDASYDYKFYLNKLNVKNYVPTLGIPVSDQAFTMLNDSIPIPEMYIGRLPANQPMDVNLYSEFAKNYFQSKNNIWNKSFLLFSGGKGENQNELEKYRSTNNQIINNLIEPTPISGLSNHFYKTTNPQSDFGPYSSTHIKDAIANGALFISYIGHSGTQTWDNSIGSPLQLKNNVNRFSLITDFGCSTGRWAEPLIKSFSEIFVTGADANALWYVGNSFLGFESNALTLPIDFFSTILKDTILSVGKAHAISKTKLLLKTGFNDPIKLAMMYTNTLIGDPAIEIALPKKVNLSIEQKNILIDNNNLTEDIDSIKIKIIISNFGLSLSDSFNVSISQSYGNTKINKTIKTKIPSLADTISFYIKIKNLPGTHSISVNLDSTNNISELREDDNFANISITVGSAKFIPISPFQTQSSFGEELIFIPPAILNNIPTSLLIDTISNFLTSKSVSLSNNGNIFTAKFNPKLTDKKRYFWKIENNTDPSKFSSGSFTTFYNSQISYFTSDSVGFSNHNFKAVNFKNGISLSKTNLHFRLISSGFYDGSFGVLEINGVNVLPNTFAGGHSITVFDTINFKIQKQKVFYLWVEEPKWKENRDSLISFINSVPAGQIVCAQIIDEGSYNINDDVRNAYRTIGSSQIEKVLNFGDSWGIIGIKGAAIGSVPELYKPSGSGKVIIDTNFVKKEFFGSLETPILGPSKTWGNITTDNFLPSNSKIFTKTIGITQNGIVDTLNTDSTLINNFNNNYPFRKYIFSFQANSNGESPVLNNWKVNLSGTPELLINSNNINLSKDSISQGEGITVNYGIHNIGFNSAESVKVNVFLNDSIPSRIISTRLIPKFNQNDSFLFSFDFISKKQRGDYKFTFIVDPENKIPEMIESNNLVEKNFYVAGDTIKPTIILFVNGERFQNNDFVSKNPEILIRFTDTNPTKLNRNDSALFSLFHNLNKINFSELILNPSSTNSSGEIIWKPILDDGENLLQFSMLDAAGNFSDTIEYRLNVSTKNKIAELFPIPNPIRENTFFTFKILGSEPPIEAEINIFTVSGKKIKTISIPNPTIGYHKIFWDTKDDDLDEIGNGVYLFILNCKFIDEEISEKGKVVIAK